MKIIYLLGLLGIISQACAPVFSEFQDAGTVGKGRSEIGASFTQTALYSDTLGRFATPRDFWGEDENYSFSNSAITLQYVTTIYYSYGILNSVDIRGFAGYITTNSLYFSPDGKNDVYKPDDVLFLALGPKISIIKDRLTFFFPFGTMYYLNTNKSRNIDSNIDGTTLHFHPTALLSFDLHENIRFTQSVKALFNFADDADLLYATNTGFAVGNSRIRIRPEIGFLFKPGEADWYMNYGLGFSFGL
ncbi:hypothetical protein EP331_03455 [bacterium]|nr:MAG: hypothetical protein EP331_03455 [bacterium]